MVKRVEFLPTVDDTVVRPAEVRPGAAPGLLPLFTRPPDPERFCKVLIPAPGEKLTLGRQSDQTLALQDERLSREHVAFSRRKERLWIQDTGSRNGTFINGTRIDGERPLQPGDVVRCGNTLLLAVEDAARYQGWPDFARIEPMLGGALMEQVRRWIKAVAPRQIEVLIQGETGTGKEVAARLLHQESKRAGPFVPVNCAAVPEALFEAELFGAKKGAFTGASADRAGLMQQARGGTLFLDEVGELPISLQPKLLRAVELREVRPLGSSEVTHVDVRLVLATNRDLEHEASQGRFREDLYHRVRGVTIELPPLRTRREDVVILAQQILLRTQREEGVSFALGARFLEQLLQHRWPGNVRELQRVVRESTVKATMSGAQVLDPEHLPAEVQDRGREEDAVLRRVRQALVDARGNVSQAATTLDISRNELYAVLREHDLKASDFR